MGKINDASKYPIKETPNSNDTVIGTDSTDNDKTVQFKVSAVSSGADGDSAYQVAVNNGFVGTEPEWLASLQGDDGDDGAVGQGVPAGGTEGQFLTKTDNTDYNTEWVTLSSSVSSTSFSEDLLPDNAVKLLVITGQSNAQGRGLNTDATAEELSVKTNCKIWVAGGVNDWQDLNIGAGNNQTTGGQHGVELGLASKFLAEEPDTTFYIVKHGDGGQDIDSMSPPSGSVYTTLNDTYLEPAINNLLGQGIIPCVYMFYSQGEADANGADYTLFSGKLDSLIKHYESKLGAKTQFIFPEILELGANSNEADINNIFNDAHVLKTNVYTVQSKAFPNADTQHWNYSGLKIIADEIYRVMATRLGALVQNNIDGYTATNFPSESLPAQVSAGEITAGTESNLRQYSPADVKSFVDQHSDNNPAQVSAGEITTGTETTLRSYSPADVKAFIDTHSGGGGSGVLIPTDVLNGKYITWLATGGGFTQVGASANPQFFGTGSNQSANFPSLAVEEQMNRRRLTSATGVGVADVARNSVSTNYKFYWTCEVALMSSGASQVNHVSFLGLNEDIAEIGNINPSSLTNILGFGYDDGDSNLQFMHNDDTGTATKVDLGSDFTCVVDDLIVRAEIYYDGTQVFYRITNLETGNTTNWSSAITTDLPVTTAGLANHLYMNAGTSGFTNELRMFSFKISYTYK